MDVEEAVMKLLDREFRRRRQRPPASRHPFLVKRYLPAVGAVDINHFFPSLPAFPSRSVRPGEPWNRKVSDHRAVICLLSPGSVIENRAPDWDEVGVVGDQYVVNFIFWPQTRVVCRNGRKIKKTEDVELACLTYPVLDRSVHPPSWGSDIAQGVKVSPHKRRTLWELEMLIQFRRDVFLNVGERIYEVFLRV
jgi:hypothetical protein